MARRQIARTSRLALTLVLAMSTSSAVIALTPQASKAQPPRQSLSYGATESMGEVVEPAETTDPLAQDAAWLAESMGLPIDDVYRRLQLQQAAGELEQKLDDVSSDTFGGLWLDQGAEFRVVVALTSGGSDSVEPYVQGTDLEQLTDVVSSVYSVADLRGWTAGFLEAALKKLGTAEGKFDVGIDIPGNSIVVTASSADWQAQLQEILASMPGVDAAAFSFGLGKLSEPSLDVYGGLALSGGCTEGFSTRTTTGGQRGVTTAAHCPNTESYAGHSLPFQAQDMQGNQDVQWHSLSAGLTAQPRVLDNSGFRTITGTLGRSGQPVGALVCAYGITTHYRCGRVTFKDFAPSYINSPAATFIVVHQTGVDESEPGDSGGPWYAGGVAYGINSGETDQVDAIYMAINYISSLQIAVLTG